MITILSISLCNVCLKLLLSRCEICVFSLESWLGHVTRFAQWTSRHSWYDRGLKVPIHEVLPQDALSHHIKKSYKKKSSYKEIWDRRHREEMGRHIWVPMKPTILLISRYISKAILDHQLPAGHKCINEFSKSHWGLPSNPKSHYLNKIVVCYVSNFRGSLLYSKS